MANRLRVVQIIPSISLVYGGPSQMVRGLSAALAKQNVDVTILTTDSNGDAGQPPLDVPLEQPVQQDGYYIRYFRCSPFRRYKFSIRLLQWLASHVSEFDVAHIHALFSPVSTAAATVARWQQLPYVLRPLGTLDPADLRKKAALKRLYAQVLERPNLAAAAAIHFTTKEEARISERFGTQTHDWIFPLGVEAPYSSGNVPVTVAHTRQELGLTDDRTPIVLFMSRIDPKKGLDLLIPALERLQQSGTPFHWVLAGANPQDPSYERAIQERVQASSLKTCTTVTGFVQGEQKAALLAAANLFVLPSYYENFGIAVAEAMLMGVPVVISKGVYIWDDVDAAAAGWICDLTVESLLKTLEQSLRAPEQLSNRGKQAQHFAQTHYNWDAIAAQMVESYRSLSQEQN